MTLPSTFQGLGKFDMTHILFSHAKKHRSKKVT